jgi:hypothetical protein
LLKNRTSHGRSAGVTLVCPDVTSLTTEGQRFFVSRINASRARHLYIREDGANIGARFKNTNRLVGIRCTDGFAPRRFDHVHSRHVRGSSSTTRTAGRKLGTARLINVRARNLGNCLF